MARLNLRPAQVIVFDDPASHLTEFAAEFLGPRENAYFSTLRFARRQQSYLLGRYAAKLALRDLLAEPDLRAIEIVRGVFEQPVVQCARSHRWCVSISHADSLAVVVAFPAGPMDCSECGTQAAACHRFLDGQGSFVESSLYRVDEPCSDLQFERVQPNQFRKLGRALPELWTVQDYDLGRHFSRCVNRTA